MALLNLGNAAINLAQYTIDGVVHFTQKQKPTAFNDGDIWHSLLDSQEWVWHSASSRWLSKEWHYFETSVDILSTSSNFVYYRVGFDRFNTLTREDAGTGVLTQETDVHIGVIDTTHFCSTIQDATNRWTVDIGNVFSNGTVFNVTGLQLTNPTASSWTNQSFNFNNVYSGLHFMRLTILKTGNPGTLNLITRIRYKLAHK